jgi:hypothetical protein
VLNQDDFFICMAPLTRHWPEPTPEQWLDYRAILGHLAPEVLAAAVLKVMATHVYPTFPKPAVILGAANEVQVPCLRSGAEAWGDVQTAIKRHGRYHPPTGIGGSLDVGNYDWTFKDPKVLALVKSLGWLYLCESEDGMADRAHFIKAYEQMQERADEALRELPAVADVRQAVLARRQEALQLMAGIGKGKA